MTSPTSKPEAAAAAEPSAPGSPSAPTAPTAKAEAPAVAKPAPKAALATGEEPAVTQVTTPVPAAAAPASSDAAAKAGEPAPASAAEADDAQIAPASAEVTRLDPSAARRPAGPGPVGGAQRAAVGPAAAPRPVGAVPVPGAGPAVTARPIAAVGNGIAQAGGPRQAASAAAGVTGKEATPVVAAPRVAAPVARPTPAPPINLDEYADAVPLPAKTGVGKPPAKPPGPSAYATYVPGPAALPARMRKRHWGLVLAFLLMVILPATLYTAYLYAFAADQYESDAGFGSRTEDAPSTFAFLGALGGGGVSSTKDMDILNQFIASQELVTRLDKKLDLRGIFSKPANDPLFAFSKTGTTEDLVKFWNRMVLPNYDSGTGLMSLRVFAFDPQDAQNIANAVLEESTSIINEMSTTAQADTTKYSAEALASAEKRMSAAQQALTDFRIKYHIVDPQAQLNGTSQLVNSLVQQMGNAEIDLDMLQGTLPETDPRITQLKRRIEVIQKRMAEETSKVGDLADTDSPGYAKLMADYANLQMEQDFAQKAYLTSLSAYDQAVNDAQHKTRYLTTYLSPTLAESTTAPNRPLRGLLALLIGFLIWSAATMIYYALRDRR